MVLEEGEPTVSALLPEIGDEAKESSGVGKSLKGILFAYTATNATDHDLLLGLVKKSTMRFGAGWDAVWEVCGGFPPRVKK